MSVIMICDVYVYIYGGVCLHLYLHLHVSEDSDALNKTCQHLCTFVSANRHSILIEEAPNRS